MAERDFDSQGTNTSSRTAGGLSRANPRAIHPKASSIHVLGFNLKKTGEKEPCVLYQIEIVSQTTWKVERRFRDIEALGQWLLIHFPKVTFPDLPSKSTGFYGLLKSREMIAGERVPLLDAFFAKLVEFPTILTCWEVQSFFEIQNQINGDTPMPNDLNEGFLYINLVGARNLPSNAVTSNIWYLKSSEVTPLGERSQLGLQTSSRNGKEDPLWYEEQVFTIRDRTRPIRVQVWEEYRLRSDKLLGHIQLDILAMNHFLMYDWWLPLVGADGSSASKSGPKIRVFAQFSPMKTGSLINFKLPNLRLQLQKQSYVAGELVRGQVVLSTHEAISDAQVIVRPPGTQLTSWVESHEEIYTDGDGNSKKRSLDVKPAGVLMKEERICLDKTAVDKENIPSIAPGFYVWPFELIIPARVSLVDFPIEALIYRPKHLQILQKTKVSLRVTSRVDTLTIDAPTPAFEEMIPTVGVDQDVSGELLCDSTIFVLGEQRTILVKICNSSKHTITKATVALRIQATKSDGIKKTKNISYYAIRDITYDGSPFPLAPGKSGQLSFVFEPPSSLAPSTSADISSLIDIKYTLHVFVILDHFGFDAIGGHRDIVVCVPPPKDTSPPEAYPSQQPSEDSIKEFGIGLPLFPSELHSVSSNQ